MKVRFVRPEYSDPARDRGIRVPYAPGKRQLARWRWYLILLVCSSPLLYFTTNMAISAMVVDAPGFISQEQMDVRAMSNGYIEQLLVKQLDPVQQGTPIARIANPELTARAEQIRAELRQLGVVESQIPKPAKPISPDSYREQIEVTRQQKEDQQKHLDMLQKLADEGAVTEGELTAARSAVQSSSAKLAELNQVMSTAGQQSAVNPRQEILTREAALKSELAMTQKQIEGLVVRAPTSGRVVDLPVAKGTQLAIGSKIAMLAPNDGKLLIAAYIPPRNVEFAIPGQQAAVIFPDGTRRSALITDVPEIAQEVPQDHPQVFGGRAIGVLVRMKFVDGQTPAGTPLTDGLPVKVRFENRDSHEFLQNVTLRLRRYWRDIRTQLAEEDSA